MKSHLRFKFGKERCIRLLREVTNETSTRSIASSFTNFDSFVKSKLLYGQFYSDGTFVLQPTTYARGSMAAKLKGRIDDVDDGEYKCHIFVEGKVPRWSWIGLLLFLTLAILSAEIWFIAAVLFMGLIIIANTERITKRGISTIIETIESEYRNEKLAAPSRYGV